MAKAQTGQRQAEQIASCYGKWSGGGLLKADGSASATLWMTSQGWINAHTIYRAPTTYSRGTNLPCIIRLGMQYMLTAVIMEYVV
jgi:hypothetical protein